MNSPSWIRVNDKHWETAEQLDGVPDYIATREPDGWRLQVRSSSKAIRGFKSMAQVRDYVTQIQRLLGQSIFN